MKQKKLKVQYRSRSRSTAHGYTDTPMIQMTGNWLEALGFSIGDTIMMEYDEDSIRIRPLTEAEKADAAREELELSIRRKQNELKALQKQIDEGQRQFAITGSLGIFIFKTSSKTSNVMFWKISCTSSEVPCTPSG